MKRYFSMILLVACAHVAQAQTELKLSLRQAQELGLQNRFDVKADQYDIEVAKREITRKKQAFLPQVQASANLSYHPLIQATLVPAGFAELSEPSLLALGAKSRSIFSLELNQPLYHPALVTEVELAHSAEALEVERTRGQEIEVKKQISHAYLNVLLHDLQHRIAVDEEQRYLAYYTLAEGRYKNGALIENDYLRARLDYENACQQAVTSQQEYDRSLRTLRYHLNVPPTMAIKLTDSLEAPEDVSVPLADLAEVRNRTEVRQLQLEEQGNSLRERLQRQAAQPRLSLAGNYSQQYLNMDFNYNYTDSKWWSPFSAIGLQLTVPLTEQFTNRASVQQAHARTLQTNLYKQQAEAEAAYEIAHAATEIANALQNLKRTQSSYELAQKVYQNQQQQMMLGAFSYDSLLNTETSLTNAERNYVKATYDYLLARLSYEIATGTF